MHWDRRLWSENNIELPCHSLVREVFYFLKKKNSNFEGVLIMLHFFFIIHSAMTGSYIFVSLDHRSKTLVELPLVVLNLLLLHKVGVTTVMSGSVYWAVAIIIKNCIWMKISMDHSYKIHPFAMLHVSINSTTNTRVFCPCIQALLEVVNDLFEEQTDLEKIVKKIMHRAQTLLKCERCSVLLLEDIESPVSIVAYHM